MRFAMTRSIATLTLIVAAACSGDGGTDSNPSIAILVAPASLSAAPGESRAATVTLTRTDYDGAVDLSVEGAPEGVAASFAPASLTGSTTTGTLTVLVGGGVPAGVYNLTIQASGQGVQAKTAGLALTVTGAPTGSFGLSLTPAALTVTQGATGTAEVGITRTGGFSGAVNLTVAGAPQGVTPAITPASATGATATLSVAVGAATAPGNYTLTITGAGEGVANQTTTLTLTVTSSSVTTSAALAYARGGEIRLVNADGGNDRAIWTAPSPQNGYAVSGLSWKPDGTEIAFASDHEQAVSIFKWDIYTVRPDGSGLRKITNAPAYDQLATYPQGAVTVRVSNISMSDAGPYFIYVLGAQEPQSVLIPAGETTTLTFPSVADLGVPQLVVAILPLQGFRWYDVSAVADVQPGTTVDAGTLNISFSSGLENFGAVGPGWRSDGAKIAYIEANTCILHQAPASPPLGTSFDNLLDPDAFTPCVYDYAPASVGVDQLLIGHFDTDAFEINILRVTEGSSTAGQTYFTYPSSHRLLWDLRWLPDGSGFLFAKQTALLDESVNVFEHVIATGATRQLTTFSSGYVRALSISPDGQSVALERAAAADGPSDVWVMRRDGSDLRLLVQNARSPAWNPRPQ
jgi:WD40 repeat protein